MIVCVTPGRFFVAVVFADVYLPYDVSTLSTVACVVASLRQTRPQVHILSSYVCARLITSCQVTK